MRITFRTRLSFWCAYVLPLPFLWLKAIMQRIFVSARKHLPCRGAVQRLSTRTTASRKTLNKLTCVRVIRAPKGSLGPKESIREIVLGSLRGYLTHSAKHPKVRDRRVCGHDRTICSVNTFTGYQPVSALQKQWPESILPKGVPPTLAMKARCRSEVLLHGHVRPRHPSTSR